MKKLTEEQLLRIWSFTDRAGMAMPYVGRISPAAAPPELWTDPGLNPAMLPDPLPFGLMEHRIRTTVFHWIMENVSEAPERHSGVYLNSSEASALLNHDTGIELTDTQMQEAMLMMGIEPYDCEQADWVFRLHRDCPLASRCGSPLHVTACQVLDVTE